MKRPSVVIADGSLFVRTMLRTILKSLDFEVIATVKDRKECELKCFELEPDIVLVDISIAEADDFALIRSIREEELKERTSEKRLEGQRYLEPETGRSVSEPSGAMNEGQELIIDEETAGILSRLAMLPDNARDIADVAHIDPEKFEAFLQSMGMQSDADAQELLRAAAVPSSSIGAPSSSIGAPSSSIILMVPEQMDIPEVIVAAVSAGVSGYLRKSASPVELRSRLADVLRR